MGGDCSSWELPLRSPPCWTPLCCPGSCTGRGLEGLGAGSGAAPGPGFSLTPGLGGAARSLVLTGAPLTREPPEQPETGHHSQGVHQEGSRPPFQWVRRGGEAPPGRALTRAPAGVPGGGELGPRQRAGGREGAQGQRRRARAGAVPGGGPALQVGGAQARGAAGGGWAVPSPGPTTPGELCAVPLPAPLLVCLPPPALRGRQGGSLLAPAGPCSTATCSGAWPSARR